MIKLKHIYKSYTLGELDVPVLQDVNLHVKPHEFVSILGPSGSGKSTLMNIIGCLDIPDSGDYILDGEYVDNCTEDQLSEIRGVKIGFIFQQFHLLPVLTARENILMPLLLDGKRPDKARLCELARFLGIEKRLKHLPGELSGGQRQRVAIARALINNPVILLADEPTGNLDKKAADEIMELLLAVNRRGNTVLLVTHEQRYADMCGRKIKLCDGKIIV